MCSSNATIQSLPIPIHRSPHANSTRGSQRTETFTSSVLLKNATAAQLTTELNVQGCARRAALNIELWNFENGGGERDRTDDLLLAKQALSQLSYTPDETGGSGWI